MRFFRLFLAELLSGNGKRTGEWADLPKECDDHSELALGLRIAPYGDEDAEALERAYTSSPNPLDYLNAYQESLDDT